MTQAGAVGKTTSRQVSPVPFRSPSLRYPIPVCKQHGRYRQAEDEDKVITRSAQGDVPLARQQNESREEDPHITSLAHQQTRAEGISAPRTTNNPRSSAPRSTARYQALERGHSQQIDPIVEHIGATGRVQQIVYQLWNRLRNVPRPRWHGRTPAGLERLAQVDHVDQQPSNDRKAADRARNCGIGVPARRRCISHSTSSTGAMMIPTSRAIVRQTPSSAAIAQWPRRLA